MAVSGIVPIQTTTATQVAEASRSKVPLADFDQFMTLFVEQLKNQDPLSPMSNGDFMAQTAQFSSLEQLTQLNDKVSAANKQNTTVEHLNAAALIGRTVTADTAPTDGSDPVTVTSRVLAVDLGSADGILLGLEDGSVVAFNDVRTVSDF